MCVALFLVYLYICVCECLLLVQGPLCHGRSAFEPGASGLPYYCPSICVRSSCTRHASCADSKPNKQTKERHKPLVVSVVVVGLFEEKEEEIDVTSDVVKVKGEDLDTPGYLRGDWVRLGRRRSQIVDASRLPWLAHDKAVGPYKTIPQYQFNTIKQHTLRTTYMRSCCNWIASCVVASPSPSL